MDLLTIVFAIVALTFGLVGKLLFNEIQDWLPTLSHFLIRKATNNLPKYARDRYGEEWLADNGDMPGKLSKLWHAFGCLIASRTISPPPTQEEWDALVKEVRERLTERIIFYARQGIRIEDKETITSSSPKIFLATHWRRLKAL